MRNLLTAVCGVLCLALFSCQKEVNDIFANNGNNNNNNTGLLIKSIVKDGTDSSITTYTYNNANKLVGINTVQTSSGTTSIVNQTVVRNSQGIIQKIIAKSPDLAQYGLDSLVSFVNYNTATGHYTNRVFKLTIAGITALSDSIAYTYDGSGKIVTMADYSKDATGSTTAGKFDFTYTGANMTTIKIYDLSSGSPVLTLTEVFDYDTKPSPLVLGNEAYVLNRSEQWFSANNIVKQTVNLVGDPVTHIINYNNTYNTFNKPVTVNYINDGQPAGTANYYYN